MQQAKRVYKLRSYIFCVSCGRRLYGKTKRQHSYYVCAPKKAWVPEGHPSSSYWVRESNLLEGLTAFLAAQVFGPYRRQLLDASLRTIDDNAQQERQARIAALRRSITETETKSKRLVRSLEIADDVDQAFIRDINERRAELRSRKERSWRQLAEDEVHRAPNPPCSTTCRSPRVDLVELPDELSRRLFEALRLEIHYDYNTRTATCRCWATPSTPSPARPRRRWSSRSQNRKVPSWRCSMISPAGPSVGRPRQDSNLRTRLRRAVLYPLSYGGSGTCRTVAGKFS